MEEAGEMILNNADSDDNDIDLGENISDNDWESNSDLDANSEGENEIYDDNSFDN